MLGPFGSIWALLASMLSPFGSIVGAFWLNDGFNQDGSKTTQAASKTPLIRRQDRPRISQDASRTAPSAPKTPPRLSKSLQDGSMSLQTSPRALQKRFLP